jgi:hypothetical protein
MGPIFHCLVGSTEDVSHELSLAISGVELRFVLVAINALLLSRFLQVFIIMLYKLSLTYSGIDGTFS